MDFRIPFSGRAHHYENNEVDAVVQVMLGGESLTQGRHLQMFEQEFKSYVKVDHAFAVSNATVALELAAKLSQFVAGDEVIIPAHTFTSSAYPFAKNGAKIVWADIDLQTRVVTEETIRNCISPNSRAVVVPHLYGFAANMPAINKLASEHELLVIEDAAQALGVVIDGQMAGTYGDFGIFSFHSHKNISTLGEGGMLVVRDGLLGNLVPLLRHNGHCPYSSDRLDYWIPAMSDLKLPVLDGQIIYPTNCCIGEAECAVGVKLIERADRINEEKRRRAINVIDGLSDHEELVFHREDSLRHNYHLLVAQIVDGKRDAFIRHMANQHGIQCVVQYCPLYRYPFYKDLGFGDANCPNTELFYDNMISFPFNHLLTDDDMGSIITCSIETLQYINDAR